MEGREKGPPRTVLDLTGFTVKHAELDSDVARGGYECRFKLNLEILFTSQLHWEGLISNTVLHYRNNHLKGNPETFNIVS